MWCLVTTSSWSAYLPPFTAPVSLQQDLCCLVVRLRLLWLLGLSRDLASTFCLEWNHILWKAQLSSLESPPGDCSLPESAIKQYAIRSALLLCLLTGLLQTRKWREGKEQSELVLTLFPVPGGSLKHTCGGREATVLLGSVGLIAPGSKAKQ